MKHILYPNHRALVDAIARANADYAALITSFDTPVTCTEHGAFYTVNSAHNGRLYHVSYENGRNGTLIASCDCPARIVCTHIGVTFHTALIARKSIRTILVDTRPVAMPAGRGELSHMGRKALADLFGGEISDYELDTVNA